jgi:TP901 family phage tail tape measure protein
MSRMSLDTAIRLSAEVKGGGNIDRVKRSLQDLAKGGQTTAKDMNALRAATFQYARANDNTIAGIRSSIGAFRGLQEQAKIGSREFNRYGAEVQKLEAKLRGLDATAEKAGASLGQKLAAGLAAAGIGRALQGITQQAASFDAELRKAAAIEGSAGSFDTLRQSVEGVAAAAAGTPAQVAALATALSRAGFSAQETAQALDGIVKGAEATDTAFDRMGGIAATVLNTFGMQAGETGKVIDVMVASANSANQTIEDLGEALSYSGSVAASLGVDMADLSGVIALLADAGIRGSRAGTTLSTGLNRLQIAAGGADSEVQGLTRGNAKLAEAMNRLGAEVLDANGKLRPMDQVLVSLRQQMQGLSTTDRSILAKALFGEEAGRGFLALLSRSEEEITSMIGKVRDSAGAADSTRAAMDSFDLSLKRLGGNVQNVTNQIGGMVGAALKPLVDALNAALGAAAKLPEPIKQLGAAAAAAGLSVLGLVVAVNALKGGIAALGGMKAIIAGMTGFKTAADVATAAQVKFNLAVLANPWALAIAGIVAATAAAYKFNEPFKQFVDTFPRRFEIFFDALRKDVDAAAARARAVITRTRDFVVSAFNAVEAKGKQAMQGLLSTLNPVEAGFRALGINIENIFGKAFESIGINWGRLVSQMLGQLNPMQGILQLLGVDIAGAMEQALNYRAPTSWQESMFGGRGRGAMPTAGPGTLPGAPDAPLLPPPGGSVPTGGAGGGGSGGGGGGGGGGAPKFELSSRGRALVAAAQKLGVSPLDLATIISFETAGTFSPSIRGGQGGNYMGLIQFGPPERQQYGAHPGQSFEEQVTGPVVRYFEDRFRGVGMSTQGASLLDLYTTVLAGNPRANRNARDSFGTSAISGVGKMEPHRQKALSTFFGGSMENVGFGAMDQAQAANAAFEDFQQRQKAATADLEKFVEARTESVTKLNQESELLKATTDYDRRRLEYAFEQNDINDRHNQIKRDFETLSQRLLELGIEYNAEQQLARIEAERQQALANARVKAEQEINDIMVERARMMQGITQQAAEPAVFQTQGMKIEDQIGKLKEDLAEMTSIATLAGRSAEGIGNAFGNAFQELISGAASARQVLSNFFLDVAKNFAQMAAEIIAKQMQMVVLQTILKALGAVAGAAGGGADFAPSDTGPFGGAGLSTALSFDPSNLAPRALGGSTATGRPYKVGENGPELFVPYQAGTIIPAEATEALEAINNASLRGLQVPFQATAATASGKASQQGSSSSTSGLSVPFQRGMEGLSVPFQRGGMDGSAAAGGGAGVIDVKFETVRIGELDFVTKDEAQRIGRESAKQGAALAQKRITNNPSTRRQAGLP